MCVFHQITAGQMSYHGICSLSGSNNRSGRSFYEVHISSCTYHLTTNYDAKYLIQIFRANQLVEKIGDLSQVTHTGLYDQNSKWIILVMEFLL